MPFQAGSSIDSFLFICNYWCSSFMFLVVLFFFSSFMSFMLIFHVFLSCFYSTEKTHQITNVRRKPHHREIFVTVVFHPHHTHLLDRLKVTLTKQTLISSQTTCQKWKVKSIPKMYQQLRTVNQQLKGTHLTVPVRTKK